MEKNMIVFTNLNESPTRYSSPAWQRDVMKRVNEDHEYQQQAIEASEMIRKEIMQKIDKIRPGYFATTFEGILHRTPRYAYIKNIDDGEGNRFVAEIDLVLHTVWFTED